MKIIAAAIIALSLSSSAFACSDPNEPSFLSSLENAENVFVFRVTSLHMIDRRHTTKSNVIAGPIEVIKTIKGKPSFQRVAYQDIRCGGIQLIVGHYYMVATRQSGATLAFVRGDNSVLDVSPEFDPWNRGRAVEWDLTNSLVGFAAGKPLDERTRVYLGWANLHNAPPPPFDR